MKKAETLPLLKIFTLGGLGLFRDQETTTSLGSRKAEALLVYLAVNGRSIPRTVLAELFWPKRESQRSHSNLRRVLYDLRRQLEPYLTTDRDSIAIRPDWVQVDVTLLQQQLAQVDQQGGLVSPRAVTELESAVSLYKGPFLHGFPAGDSRDFESWLWSLQQQLEHQAIAASQQLVIWYLAHGPYIRGFPHAERLLQLDPYRETNIRQYMRLLVYSDKATDALARYEQWRQMLWQELGVEPERETADLYRQIRTGNLTTSKSVPLLYLNHPAALPAFLKSEDDPVALPVFVAREKKLNRLNTALEQALSGQTRPLFLSGEPGTGKTALATVFARRIQEQQADLLVAWGQCQAHSGPGDAYQPFRGLMAMLTGDVELPSSTGLISSKQARRLWQAAPLAGQVIAEQGPDLIGRFLAGPPLLNRMKMAVTTNNLPWLEKLEELAGKETAGWEEGQQAQFFDQFSAVLQSLSRERPLLLILDDLQWADVASLDLLFHLIRNLSDGRICLIGAYRPDEVAVGRLSHLTGQMERHPLEKVLAECRSRSGEVLLSLDEIAPDEELAFVNAYLDTEPNNLGKEFRQSLAQQTKGQPLFTVELLKALQEREELVKDEDGRWQAGPSLNWNILPARVEGVIAERIGRLDKDLLETLTIASVEGETFTAQVVARIRGVADRELVRQFSRELDRKHRLVTERSPHQVDNQRLFRYRFRHNLFQQHLYKELGKMERELLHGDVGRILESLYAGREREIAAQLAWHYSEANESDKAIEYLLMAGDKARNMYANDEAVGHYERAVAFLKAENDNERAARTLMKLGLTYHNAFAFGRARQTYLEGFELWKHVGKRNPQDTLPKAPHPLRVSWPNPDSLDPTYCTTNESEQIINLLFSGLVELSPNQDLIPDVASSWEVIDDGKQYRFILRDDVQWSDGTRVTANDFVYAFHRALVPTTRFNWPEMLYVIKGAKAFNQGELINTSQLGVRAVDDTVLIIDLERPTSYFLYLLTLVTVYPLPRHNIEKYGDSWTEAENIVSNGPFLLESWQKQKAIVLARNPNYHGYPGGNVQKIALTLARSWGYKWTDRLATYKGGGLDIVHLFDVPPEKRNPTRQQLANEYFRQPFLATAYVAFDITRPPFDSQQVRRAFVLAVNRELIVDEHFGDTYSPGIDGLFPPGLPGHTSNIGLPYNPDLACELLAAAGYPGGHGFPVVIVTSYLESYLDPFIEAWRKILGVSISYQSVSWERFEGMLRLGNSHIVAVGESCYYPDPQILLNTETMKHLFPNWQHTEFSILEEEAMQTRNQSRRIELYKKMDRLMVQEAVLMPIDYDNGNFELLIKPWIKNLPPSQRRFLSNLKDVIIEPHDDV